MASSRKKRPMNGKETAMCAMDTLQMQFEQLRAFLEAEENENDSGWADVTTLLLGFAAGLSKILKEVQD